VIIPISYAVTAGFPLVLVKPHSTGIIGVDRDTYQCFPDGALARAVVLPLSRLAVKWDPSKKLISIPIGGQGNVTVDHQD
jgi:hypothetical protein